MRRQKKEAHVGRVSEELDARRRMCHRNFGKTPIRARKGAITYE